MLQIRVLGQFDVRVDGKRVVIPTRAAQSIFAFLVLTAGTSHRREKLAGQFWPDTTEENARKNLRQELWRIRKAISSQHSGEEDYLIADEFTLKFNRDVEYWLDVSQMEKPDTNLQSLIANLSLYQGELLPGFYDEWVTLERERVQAIFEARMQQLLDQLIVAERWIAVQEWGERWLMFSNAREPAYRALMLASGVRGDMAKVSSIYQRCVEDLHDQLGIEPSAETRALYEGLLKGAQAPRREATVQPSGTVTFLFTDIQGSTRLLDKLGKHYATSLAEHHRILRAAIQKWNGHEMDTQGDAFFVTFARALDAVQCAVEAQRMLASYTWTQDEPIRVRMGLHTGEPLITSTGYVGMDVHRAARIGDAGHGGQVLLSQTTRELVIHDLPSDITIRDLGEHRLKDMKYPTPIYQLSIDGLQNAFPPLKTKFTGSEAPVPGEPPFKGLQYFDEADSDLFFGREVLTEKLLERLRASRFLSVVIGASGSGKSSLVRAGLIPALKKESKLAQRQADWQVHIITPTAHPLEALATELTRDSESVTAAATFIDDLMQDPRSLSLFLGRRSRERHTLLVVDQFEELFTLCRDEFEQGAFIDNLLTALQQCEDRFTLLLTLRADFYAHLAQYPELRDAVAKHQEYIGPMSMDELRRAMEEPAKRGHWEFEPGLVDLILRDVGDEPGALPLLSHALLETWKRRAGHTLTLKGYADAGGVHGAIAHTAEGVYQSLSSEEQGIARDIFLRLTELGEGTEDTRRRASFEELMSHTESTEEVRNVLNRLAEARLITLGEATAEVAHEALIREWPTLREWLNQDREGLRLHRHLTEAAHDWELLERDPGALYRGTHLAQAREWAELHPNSLNAGERAFLNASVDQEQREEQEREEQHQRELAAAKELAETQRQSASRLRIRNRVISTVGTIAIILALLVGMFGVQSNRNAAQAESNFNRAEAQRLALEANRLLLSGGSSEQIALLSLRSMNTHYSPEGDAALAAAERLDYPVRVFAHTSPITDVAFSPDGRYVLTGSIDKTVTLWDFESGKEIRQFTATDPILDVAYSPDGKYILAQSDKIAIVWDTTTGAEVHRLVHDASLISVEYSHDGKSIFTSAQDFMVREWDAERGQEVRVIGEDQPPDAVVTRISISPDDRYMLTGSTTAQLWELKTGRMLHEFAVEGSKALETAFSPDGNFVLTGNTDNLAHLWDIKTGNEVHTFAGNTATIFGMRFSPDNKYVLTAGGDNALRVWDIDTGQELLRFTYPGALGGIAVSPDGKWVLSGCEDGAARLWNLKPTPPLPTFNHGGWVAAVAFSPDGRFVLTGGEGGTARLWDAATGKHLQDFVGHTDFINYGAAFSADGKYIITAGGDKMVRIWDARTGNEVQLIGHTASVSDGEFSPNGRYILTAGDDGVRLSDARTGQEIRQFGDTIRVQRATFSPDGNTILNAAPWPGDGKARLWDVATGRLIREYQTPMIAMESVAFSPDGKTLLTAGQNVQLWEVETGRELHQFVGHTDYIFTAAFSPNGKYIATASADSTARLWDVQSGQELRRFIGHTAGLENVVFSPDGKYILTGSDDGTAMLWDVDYHTTMKYLCSVLLRDFTDDERAQYGITDNMPTCP